MLNDRLNAYLAYFEQLATQPPNRWEGFYLTQRETRSFGLRFQITFPCYALAALCQHPDASPGEQERCRAAMAALIARMIQRRVWAYWGRQADMSGISPDPVYEANIQYSGPLAMMIGAYEAVGGDERYDEGFTLLWNSDNRFDYTHTSLVEAIWRQMVANEHHGVDCAVGRTYVAHMAHALWATLLHDELHGSTYASVNAQWLDFMRRKLTFRGLRLPGRGAFSGVYFTRLGMSAPIGLNFMDAWSLALLAAVQPDLTRTLATRFLLRVRRSGDGLAYVPSAGMWRGMEVCDLAVNTGFGYLLAVELGDSSLAEALLRYADTHLQPSECEGRRAYQGGLSAPYTTALFALGEAGGFGRLRGAGRSSVYTSAI